MGRLLGWKGLMIMPQCRKDVDKGRRRGLVLPEVVESSVGHGGNFFPGALEEKSHETFRFCFLDTARSRSEYHRTWYRYPGTGRVHDFSEHRMVQVKQKIYYTWTVGHVDVYYTAVYLYLYTFDLCPFVLFV